MHTSELENVQQRIRAQFQANMAALQQYLPDIFQRFSQYQPKELTLGWDARGYLNLVNMHNNMPVYPQNPEQYAQIQVEEFIRTPLVASVAFYKGKIINQRHSHGRLTNDLVDKTAEYIAASQPDCKAPIGTLIVTGCGMGYHLELLMKKLDVRNLIIYEAHMDCMYASLHCIDWRPILEKLSRPKRLLQLYLAFDPVVAIRNMRTLKEKIGMHNLIYTYIYRHLDSPQEASYIEQFYRENHLNFFGAGFFDDEQVGLSHTIHNLNNHTKIFKANTAAARALPAFIIGNGPSLDEHIEFIKEHRENAVLFSCGTALSSLSKAGIKPDFHVEMERNVNIVEWIKQGTTEAQRKGLTLLCLNTSSPKVIELFDDACMAKKPFDIGESLIDQAMGGLSIPSLTTPNPTVTNAGLSFVLHMGFSTIYLIGVDLGLASDGKHHSKLSIYQDLENKTKEKGHSPIENTDNNYLIPANFSGQVSTNHILDNSRQNMEYLMYVFLQKNPHIRGFNSNRGAKIAGFTAIEKTEIVLEKMSEEKPLLLAKLRADHFYLPNNPVIDEKTLAKKGLKNFLSFRGKLTLRKDIDSAEALMDELDTVFHRVLALKESDPLGYRLLIGSVNNFFTIIAKTCLFQKNRAKFIEAYTLCRASYMQFIKDAYTLMESDPLMLDDTYDKVAIRLKDEATK